MASVQVKSFFAVNSFVGGSVVQADGREQKPTILTGAPVKLFHQISVRFGMLIAPLDFRITITRKVKVLKPPKV